MQILERVGLGCMFWVGGTIGFLILGIFMGVVRGSVTTGPSHATGLSAVVAGLAEATLFNPLYWLGVLAAFGWHSG